MDGRRQRKRSFTSVKWQRNGAFGRKRRRWTHAQFFAPLNRRCRRPWFVAARVPTQRRLPRGGIRLSIANARGAGAYQQSAKKKKKKTTARCSAAAMAAHGAAGGGLGVVAVALPNSERRRLQPPFRF